jgi:hypothetical protein
MEAIQQGPSAMRTAPTVMTPTAPEAASRGVAALHAAPTILTPSVTEALLEESRPRSVRPMDRSPLPSRATEEPLAADARAASEERERVPRHRARAVEPAKSLEDKPKRRRGGFSETAWFMRPDQAVDPETGRVKFDPRAYEHDDTIPEEKRRRFSLRRKNEE